MPRRKELGRCYEGPNGGMLGGDKMRGDYHLNEAEIAYWRPLLEEKIKRQVYRNGQCYVKCRLKSPEIIYNVECQQWQKVYYRIDK